MTKKKKALKKKKIYCSDFFSFVRIVKKEFVCENLKQISRSVDWKDFSVTPLCFNIYPTFLIESYYISQKHEFLHYFITYDPIEQIPMFLSNAR